MEERMIGNYREVSLDTDGKGYDRHYKNPLSKTYQYEYALYLAISELFGSVRPCRLALKALSCIYMNFMLPRTAAERLRAVRGLYQR